MAGIDSVVNVNEGVNGKNLHYIQRSIASNTDYQQAVVVSEAYLPTYSIATSTAVSTATAASHLVQVMAGPLNRVLIRRVLVTQLVGAGSATAAVLQLVRLTSAGTGGTPITPTALDPTSSVSAVASQTLPSSKGSEGSVIWTSVGNVLQTPAVAGEEYVIDWQWDDPRKQPPTIAAGVANGLALKLVTAVATGTVHILVEYSEAFWS